MKKSNNINLMKNVKEFLNNNKVIILAVVLSLIIRSIFFIAFQPWNEQVLQNKILIWDAAGYYKLAVGILNTESFSPFNATRTPGYPIFIAFIFFLIGIKVWCVLLIQLLLDTGVVITVYFIAKEIFESKYIHNIAAFLYSICFISAYHTTRLLTDILFVFLFTLSILVFIQALKKNRLRGFILTGFIMGITTLIRPILQYFPFIVLIIIVLQKNIPIQKIYNFIAFLLMFAVIISPWQFRNLYVFDHYALSNIKGYMLYCSNAARTKATLENIDLDEAQEKLKGSSSLELVENPFIKSRILQEIAMKYISDNLIDYTYLHIKGFCNIFIGTAGRYIMDALGIEYKKTKKLSLSEGSFSRIERIIKNSYNEYFIIPILAIKLLFEYAFFFCGLIYMFYKENRRYALFFLIIILYFTVITGVGGYCRYKIPVVPIYLVISAAGIFGTINYIKDKNRVRTNI